MKKCELMNGSGKPSSLSKFTSLGVPLSPITGFTGGGLNESRGLSVDALGNIWVSNTGNNSISRFTNAGVALSPAAGYTGGGLLNPISLSVSPGSTVWAANSGGGDSISSFSLSGSPLSPSTGITGGGLTRPQGIASDSSANVWVSSGRGVSEFDGSGNPLSPNIGFVDTKSIAPQDVAIDPSGNAWVANKGDGSIANSTLTQFVGAAAPVITPVFGPPATGLDEMINVDGFFNRTVVRTIAPGQNVNNPTGYLRPIATANGNGTVTLAVQDNHVDTTEQIVDYRLPGTLSNPYMNLTTNRFLQFLLSSVNAGRRYNINILFFGPGATNPTFLEEVAWLTNSTNLNPILDVSTLAPAGEGQYFIRFRLFPATTPGNVLTIDSASTSR